MANNLIIFDSQNMLLLSSNQVEYRIPLQEELSDLSFLGIDNAYSRISNVWRKRWNSVVDSKAAGLLEGFEGVEYFNSIDEIPEISDEELEALAELGEIEEVENMKYGNPADLSYQETIIEMYNDIENNNLDEYLFKIIEE